MGPVFLVVVVVFVLKGVVGHGWVWGLGRGSGVWVVNDGVGMVVVVFGCDWCFWLWFFEWVCSGGFQIGSVVSDRWLGWWVWWLLLALV